MIDSCHGLGLGHGSPVMRVMGQLTDGSRGSRVTKCDPLSALRQSHGKLSRIIHKLQRSSPILQCNYATVAMNNRQAKRTMSLSELWNQQESIWFRTRLTVWWVAFQWTAICDISRSGVTRFAVTRGCKATDGVIPIFSWKKLTTFFSHRRLLSDDLLSCMTLCVHCSF